MSIITGSTIQGILSNLENIGNVFASKPAQLNQAASSPFILSITGIFTATCVISTSIDNGITWIDGSTTYTQGFYTIPTVLGTLYRLKVNSYTRGTILYEIWATNLADFTQTSTIDFISRQLGTNNYNTLGLINTGAWISYQPTAFADAATGTMTASGVPVAKYCQIGKTVHVYAQVQVVTNGTGSNAVRVSLPIVPNATGFFCGSGRDITSGNKVQSVVITNTTVTGAPNAGSMNLKLYDGTYPAVDGWQAVMSATYETL